MLASSRGTASNHRKAFQHTGCQNARAASATVRCYASNERPESTSGAALAAAAVSALALLASPLDALAVSGGGGISKPISFEDWSHRDLTKMKFTKVTAKGTNFEGSNMEGISMFGGFFEEANFKGVNMRNADIESAKFAGADLTDVVLAGAYAENAQLAGVASITNSDWTDVDLRKDVRKALCEIAKGTNPVTQADTRESLMCP